MPCSIVSIVNFEQVNAGWIRVNVKQLLVNPHIKKQNTKTFTNHLNIQLN